MQKYLSRDMRFPTIGYVRPASSKYGMWYVRPAKAQTRLRIHAVWPEPLLVA